MRSSLLELLPHCPSLGRKPSTRFFCSALVRRVDHAWSFAIRVGLVTGLVTGGGVTVSPYNNVAGARFLRTWRRVIKGAKKALSGTGEAQATLTPAGAKFATEKVGATSPAKVFTLTNKQAVALTSIAISTTGDFSVCTTTCPTSLAAKATCKISVVFKPTQTGTRTAELKVTDSAVGSPQMSSLTGTGD